MYSRTPQTVEAKKVSSVLARALVILEEMQEAPEIRMMRLSLTLK